MVLVGIMKYLRRILMSQEMFFKIFDGPQNIFSCSNFLILVKGVGTLNIQNSYQGDLAKTRHVK